LLAKEKDILKNLDEEIIKKKKMQKEKDAKKN